MPIAVLAYSLLHRVFRQPVLRLHLFGGTLADNHAGRHRVSRSDPWHDRPIGDTKVLIDPSALAERLVAAGFEDAVVHAGRDAFRFRAYAGSGKASSPAATASESRFSGGASGHAQREL